MEERVADKTEFTECWHRTTESPYIMRLALSAGIGGLLFGYDTGHTKNNNPSSNLMTFSFILNPVDFINQLR